MNKFIGTTIGLECNGYGKVGKMIAVEYTRLADGSVQLKPISGRSLAEAGETKTVAAEEFDNRPTDPYQKISEARWALNKCGWSLMADDAEQDV